MLAKPKSIGIAMPGAQTIVAAGDVIHRKAMK